MRRDPLDSTRDVPGFRVTVGGAYSDVDSGLPRSKSGLQLEARLREVVPSPRAYAWGKFHDDYEIEVTVRPRRPCGARAYQHDPADAPAPQYHDRAADLACEFAVGFS